MTLFGYKITFTKVIKKKVRKRKGGYTRLTWSAQDTQLILDSSNSGMSPEEISETVLRDRTPAAIGARLYKVRKK